MVLRRVLPILVLLACAALGGAGSAQAKTVWLCKPGLKHNPCTPGLATTRFAPTGEKLGVDHPKPVGKAKIDCFYVYPTVSDQKRDVATRHIDPEERSIALYQAARYSQRCRVYAPMYRQGTLQALSKRVGTHIAGLAAQRTTPGYADVRAAWNDYLRHDNHGRGVILIGHSQGSFVLRALIAKEIDPKRAVRRRILSAILLGGNVEVKQGRGVGGDFQHIPACRSRTQLGCVIAFSTFAAKVPANSLFGRTTAKGRAILCTNPAALGGGSGLANPVFPSAPFAPGSTIAAGITLLDYTQPTAATPWVAVPGAFRARCSSAGGAHVLQITAQRGGPTPTASPDPTWGLHLVDANVELGNLLTVVRDESAAYAKRVRRG